MGTRSKAWTSIAVALSTLAVVASPARSADFYAGKTIDLVIGGAPAGGIDLYARTFGRHVVKHIPGTPSLIAKNLPGASGARAMNHVAVVSPNDGLTIGAITPGAIVAPILNNKPNPQVDPAKLIYLGTTNAGVGICATMSTSKTVTFEDALKRETLLGAQGPGAVSFDIAYLVKNLTGAKFKVVTGYNGSTHFLLAMERGEIEGICGWNWSSAKSQKPDWLRDKKLNLLLQTGVEEDEELTKLGVPPIWKFIASDEGKKIAAFVLAQKGFERPLMLAPGTPADRVKILRSAFDSTMKDAAFLAEMEKARLDVAPASGAKVQAMVESFYSTPKEIVAKARKAMGP